MRVLVVPCLPAPRGPSRTWKLVGDNNRALARSPLVHASDEECQEDLRALAASLAAAEVCLERRDGLWRWSLRVADVDRATSARGYPSRRDALASASRFAEALPVAVGA